MPKQTTRIVGPWDTFTKRENRINEFDKESREKRLRPFRLGGMFWLEVWPAGTSKFDPTVLRAPLPNVAKLPPLWWRESPNDSSRNGAPIRGIVWHETQGSYQGAVSWLCNPKSQVSAHVVIAEDGGSAHQLVTYSRKAWHAANANSWTIGIELAGYVDTPNNVMQLRNAARIGAAIGAMFGIPPVIGNERGEHGHVTHRMLGEFGGGHTDPGGFDFERFVYCIAVETSKGNLPKYGRV